MERVPTPADRGRPLLFKAEQVGLLQDFELTEQQKEDVKRLYTTERTLEYLNIFPTTIVVHKKAAAEKLDIKQCVYITRLDAANFRVFPAPKFCCRNQPKQSNPCPNHGMNTVDEENRIQFSLPFHSDVCGRRFYRCIYNGYRNMDRSDAERIETTAQKPELPSHLDANKLNCWMCNKHNVESLEFSLFSLECGHFACRSCWLKYARKKLASEVSPLPCMNGTCGEKMSIGLASAIFDAPTLGIMRNLQWRARLQQKDNVRCAGCKKWLERNHFYRRVRSFNCVCGCYTCVRCGQYEHSPLRCDDAALWEDIKKDREATSRALEELNLDEDSFEQCLSSQNAVNGEQWTTTIQSIKSRHLSDGRDLDRDMRMVAALLQQRCVQVMGGRKQLKPASHLYQTLDVEQVWSDLEQAFAAVLAMSSYERRKYELLRRHRDEVLYLYNF